MKKLFLVLVFVGSLFGDDYDCSGVIKDKGNTLTPQEYCRFIAYINISQMTENHNKNTGYKVSDLGTGETAKTLWRVMFQNGEKCYSTCLKANTIRY